MKWKWCDLWKNKKKKKMKMMRKDEERMKDEQSAIMKDRSSIWARCASHMGGLGNGKSSP